MNLFVWLCMVTLLLALSSKSQVIGKNGHVVDCKKYVFAPVCRGAATKRTFPLLRTLPQRINYEDLAEEILENYPFNRRKSHF
ncbi:hypothetical protein O3M35_006417 [Rhynocoris fuscipes]|uniref:Uncharacterized protein n=1 Tax=Rhynocoris fuscipes TaxID=488301 RepID=A0AAW1DG00_9HEMI